MSDHRDITAEEWAKLRYFCLRDGVSVRKVAVDDQKFEEYMSRKMGETEAIGCLQAASIFNALFKMGLNNRKQQRGGKRNDQAYQKPA